LKSGVGGLGTGRHRGVGLADGARASELRGLPWRDVDLDAGVVHVRQRADKGGNIGPPKSKRGKRDIPLAPIVVNALRQWHRISIFRPIVNVLF
jgi:integrase